MEILILLALILPVSVMAIGAGDKHTQDNLRVSRDRAKDLIDDSHVEVIDVRQQGGWDDSASKIEGAVRRDPQNVDKWAQEYSEDDTLLLYCS